MDGKDTSRSQQAMTTVIGPMDGWNTIPWSRIQRDVFKLQKRIYVRREGRVPASETPGLRRTPPGTPSSLSPRKRVSLLRLRRE